MIEKKDSQTCETTCMGTVKNEGEAKNSKGQYFRGDQGSGMDRAVNT